MILKEIALFVAHWYHALAFILGACFSFSRAWVRYGTTEQLVREAMQLSQDSSDLQQAAMKIWIVQRVAIHQMRFCMLAIGGILWIMLH